MMKELVIVAGISCLSPVAVGAQQPLAAERPCQAPSAAAATVRAESARQMQTAAEAVRYEVVDGAVYMVYGEKGLRLPMSGGGATGCVATVPSSARVAPAAMPAPAAEPSVEPANGETSVP